ncbi:MAG: ATP-dependent Clp protease adapter ClpS [Acidimicrobiia bacterium]
MKRQVETHGVAAGTAVIPAETTVVKDSATTPWKVVVWNDPVNLMSYVVLVLRMLFGYPAVKATRLMLQIHYEGKAVVAHGPLERAEADCYRLHHHGLWATLEQ